MSTAATAAGSREAELAKIRTMRDVFDFCQKYGLCSVAQGMIEIAPPRQLREIVAADVLRDSHEIHQYGARVGAAPYLAAVHQFLASMYGINVPAKSIIASSGVSGAIVATLLALRQKGKNRVAVLEPFYTYHKRQIEEVYGECKYHVPTNADFSPNWDTLEAAFSGPEALHGIIVTNPGNPTGKVWSKEDMLRLVSIVKKANAVLIVDEIYCDMIWKGRHFSPLEEGVSPNVVVCRGWAKSLAAQSWRIGFCVTDPDFAQEILTQHDPVYIAVNWQQYSLAKYLTGHLADYKRHVAENSRIMQHNWKLLSELLQSVLGWTPLEPQGSMYGLFKHTEENDGAALRRALDHGIGVAAGSMFFGTGDTERTGLIRIHYGFDAATVDRICASVREHKKKH